MRCEGRGLLRAKSRISQLCRGPGIVTESEKARPVDRKRKGEGDEMVEFPKEDIQAYREVEARKSDPLVTCAIYFPFIFSDNG